MHGLHYGMVILPQKFYFSYYKNIHILKIIPPWKGTLVRIGMTLSVRNGFTETHVSTLRENHVASVASVACGLLWDWDLRRAFVWGYFLTQPMLRFLRERTATVVWSLKKIYFYNMKNKIWSAKITIPPCNPCMPRNLTSGWDGLK